MPAEAMEEIRAPLRVTKNPKAEQHITASMYYTLTYVHRCGLMIGTRHLVAAAKTP